MYERDPFNFRKAAYSAEDWRRREAIFERVFSGQDMTDEDRAWMVKHGMKLWEYHGKRVL